VEEAKELPLVARETLEEELLEEEVGWEHHLSERQKWAMELGLLPTIVVFETLETVVTELVESEFAKFAVPTSIEERNFGNTP
jgi:hypothetical protein